MSQNTRRNFIVTLHYIRIIKYVFNQFQNMSPLHTKLNQYIYIYDEGFSTFGCNQDGPSFAILLQYELTYSAKKSQLFAHSKSCKTPCFFYKCLQKRMQSPQVSSKIKWTHSCFRWFRNTESLHKN